MRCEWPLNACSDIASARIVIPPDSATNTLSMALSAERELPTAQTGRVDDG